MKFYPHVVTLITALATLAVPALCQKPSPFPEPAPSADVMPSLSAQTADLDYQAAKMALDAQGLAAEKALSADQVEALSEQAAVIAGQIDTDRLSEMAAKAAAMADQLSINTNIDLKLSLNPDDMNDMKAAAIDMANQARDAVDQSKMAFLQAPVPPVAPRAPKAMIAFRGRDDAYNAGTRALDEHKYDEAVQHFDNAIQQDPSRAEGALYWKAYALNREGKRDEALAAIAQLRRDYASSAWLHDAQALEAEVKQGNGQPVSPAQESNDDLKLLAINSLMNADPERALPLVENILKGNSGPSVKDRALFVISQNRSARAASAARLRQGRRQSGSATPRHSICRNVGNEGSAAATGHNLHIFLRCPREGRHHSGFDAGACNRCPNEYREERKGFGPAWLRHPQSGDGERYVS